MTNLSCLHPLRCAGKIETSKNKISVIPHLISWRLWQSTDHMTLQKHNLRDRVCLRVTVCSEFSQILIEQYVQFRTRYWYTAKRIKMNKMLNCKLFINVNSEKNVVFTVTANRENVYHVYEEFCAFFAACVCEAPLRMCSVAWTGGLVEERGNGPIYIHTTNLEEVVWVGEEVGPWKVVSVVKEEEPWERGCEIEEVDGISSGRCSFSGWKVWWGEKQSYTDSLD